MAWGRRWVHTDDPMSLSCVQRTLWLFPYSYNSNQAGCDDDHASENLLKNGELRVIGEDQESN